MLVVTVELYPKGLAIKSKKLGQCFIINNLTGTPTKGDYVAHICVGKKKKPWKTVFVTGFPRKNLNAWHLLYRTLKKAIGEE